MAFGPVFGRTMTAPFGGGGAAVPYSLYYDQSGDYVDCGTPASLMYLNAGAFTVDVYWRCPASVPNWSYLTLASQGKLVGPYAGWTIRADFGTSGTFQFVVTLGGAAQILNPATRTLTMDAWYYVRLRKTGAGDMSGNTYSHLSYNAGAEGNTRFWGADVTSAANFYHGRSSDASPYLLKGNICYVHAWNTNKGALLSVPSAPFAVDANTVGRWVYGNGSGTTLTDSGPNANHGTISGATWQTTVPPGWTI